MKDDYIKGNYKAIFTWRGYKVQKAIENNKFLYITSVYKGQYKFSYDFTYAKYFKKLETAKKHIDILIDQERNQ